MRQNFAFLIEYGFHDIKNFLYSGLSDQIAAYADITWLLVDKKNEELYNILSNSGHKVVILEENALNIKNLNSNIKKYHNYVFKAWMRNQNHGNFHNYKVQQKSQPFDSILGSTILKGFLSNLYINKCTSIYNSININSVLSNNNITDIFLLSTSSPLALSLLNESKKLGINPHLIINTWKNLFINGFIPTRVFESIFVWSKRMKDDMIHINPHIPENSIHITGNPIFDRHIEYEPTYPKSYYCEKYGIDENKTWIYYTMVNPTIYEDEILFIKELAEKMQSAGLSNKYELLIRLNPNHTSDQFNSILLPNICKFTEHYFTYNKELDLTLQSREGEDEWMDMIYYTNINISIPSMVTAEYLMMNKKVINFTFDHTENKSDLLTYFLSAGFYKHLISNNLVRVCHDYDGIISELPNIDSSSNTDHLTKQQEVSVYAKSIQNILKKIIK